VSHPMRAVAAALSGWLLLAALAASGPSGLPADLAAPGVEAPGGSEAVPVPEPDAKALAYYRSGNVLWLVGELFGLAFPLVLLATGWSARMRSRAERIGRQWLGTIAVYAVFYRALD